MPDIEYLPLKDLRSWPRNARTHPPKQVQQLASSIRRFGFTHPVLVDEDNFILAGHGRVSAAVLLGLVQVPCLRITHMSQAEKRAYVLADNKLALNAGWDRKLLAEELKDLLNGAVSFDIGVTGFSITETDLLIATHAGDGANAGPEAARAGAVTPGGADNIIELGPHRLICRDRIESETVDGHLRQETPRMLIAVDEAGPAGDMDTAWAETLLIAADRCGLSVFLAEGDPTRRAQLVRRWKDHQRDTDCRPDGEAEDDTMPEEEAAA